MTISKSVVGAFVVLLLFGSLSFASDVNFPSPQGCVNDFARCINSSNISKISATAKNLREKNGCEITIVTIDSTEPIGINSYAAKLFNKWRMGEEDGDKGVLILAAIKDKKIKIEVGYGLEDVLTDDYCGKVLDEKIIPAFKEGEYGQGLYAGTVALAEKLSKEYNPTGAANKKHSDNTIIKVLSIVGVAIIIAVLIALGLAILLIPVSIWIKCPIACLYFSVLCVIFFGLPFFLLSLIVLIPWMTGAILVAIWADKLCRNIIFCVLGCILFSPLIVAIYYLIVGGSIKCHFCKGSMHKDVTVCSHCGKEMPK